MNFRKLLFLSGTSALLLTTTIILPSNQNPAMAKPGDSAAEPVPRNNNLEKLDLTEAQKTKLKSIRDSSLNKMNAILTPEQQEKMRTAMSQRKKPTNLNLTQDQINKIQALKASTKNEMMSVLTPQQKQKLQEISEARKAKGNNNNPQKTP